jgi:cyanophycinase-like exopeptidase
VVVRTEHLFVQCQCGDSHGHVGTDMVMRTGYLYVQFVDRHGHEDRTLICSVCEQTWS